MYFSFVDNPQTVEAFSSVMILYISSVVLYVNVDANLMKHAPKQIRGQLNSVFNCFGNIGLMFFIYFAGKLYDSWSPKAPFYLMALGDSIVVTIFIILVMMGKIKD